MQTKSSLHKNLEITLGYTFKNLNILIESLVHKSYAHEKASERVRHNERLEFLGDAVLGFTISDLLMKRFPDASEGELSKMKASVVNESYLAKLAMQLDLGKLLYLGKGEEQTKGRLKPSILSNTYEALLAAIYLDGGFPTVYKVIQQHFRATIESSIRDGLKLDAKTSLQEVIQASHKKIPQYSITKEAGPDHSKTFEVRVDLTKDLCAFGSGKSKKEAEQSAASNALKLLKENESF